MKSGNLSKWGLVAGLAILPGASFAAPVIPNQPEATFATVSPSSLIEGSAGTIEGEETLVAEQRAEPSLSEASASPVSSDKPLPPHIRAIGPLAEIIKLANSGVDENVMLAFVTNSPNAYNLSAEEIIYLNDIGVPSSVVTAMMQRDQALKASPSPPVGLPPTAATTGPVPAQVAPQWDPSAEAYPAQPVEDASYANFYDALAPYGAWADVEGYGRCWQPTAVMVDPGWRPYFDCGHWVYTDYGWYWLSDYSWGWAPFHYGRWFQHHRLGWCWAPDTVWGPSWVSWRYTDDYCGWAPLPPLACYSPGIGFTYYGQPVGFSFSFGLGWDCFAFVGWHHFHDHHLHHFGLAPHQAREAFGRSTAVTRIVSNRSTIINEGIPVQRVAAATHQDLRPVSLRRTSDGRPTVGRVERFDSAGRSLTVYQPHIAVTPRLAPSAVEHGVGRGHSLATPPSRSAEISRPAQPHVPQATSPRADGSTGRGPVPQSVPERIEPWGTRLQSRVVSPVSRAPEQDPIPKGALILRGHREPVPSASTTAQRSETVSPPPRTWSGFESRPSSPADGPVGAAPPSQYIVPSYQAPARPAPAEVPRYAPTPSYAPQRPTYMPAPSYAPAPARQSFAPAPSMSAPSRAPAMESRPAPSAPAASSSSHGSSNQGGRGSR